MTKWTYDADGHEASMTDPLGDETTYTYDARGDLTSTTAPHGPGDDPKEFTTSYAYNNFGEVTQTLNPDGSGTIDNYDAQGNQISETDLDGNVSTASTYGADGQVLSTTADGSTTTYGYDAKGRLTNLDEGGDVTTTTYDAAGRILTTSGDGQDTATTYDADGRAAHEATAGGATVDFGYAGSGQDWSSIDVSTVGPVDRKLDAAGKVTEWDTPQGKITYAYDADGRVVGEADIDGSTTTYGYDALGRQTSMTDSATGVVTSSTFDLAGRVATRTANGVTTAYTYEPDGDEKTMTVGGQTWTYSYTPTSTTVTDPLGHATTTETTPDGLTSRTTLADGSQSTSTSLPSEDGSQGQPASSVDAEGRRRTYLYDASGDLTSTTDLAGVASTLTYDASGVHLTGPTGRVLTLASDAQGRQSGITYADGSKTTFTYADDNATDPSTVTLASGAVITDGYDAAGDLTSRDTTTGEHATFGYTDGQLTSTTDASGATSYTYDASGNLASVTQASGASVAYQRDASGRLEAVSTRTSPASAPYVTTYHYGPTGDLDSVTDPLGGATTYTYDAADRLSTRTLPDGVVTTYRYDVDDRVTSVVHRQADGTVIASYAYTRAGDGEPTRIDREDGSYVTMTYDAALRLSGESYFDVSGHLQEALTYAYDSAGDRSVATDSTGSHTYTYDADKLASASNPSGAADTFGHDADGDVSTIARDGTDLSLGYDTSGHLTSVAGTAGGAVSYTYNAEGDRVAASDGPDGSRLYLTAPTDSDGLNSPYLVTNTSGALAAGYVYVGSTPLLRFGADGKPVYYLEDAMDSVVGLADSGGDSVAKFDYDGFGNLRSSSGPDASAPAGLGGDFRFQGSWLDRATNLYDMRARTYDPRTGLFLSRDPKQPNLLVPEEQDLYTFANANPRLYADPSGQFELVEVQVSISTGDFIDGINAYAQNEVRQRIRQKLGDLVINQIINALKAINPEIKQFFDALSSGDITAKAAGQIFGTVVGKAVYTQLNQPNYAWFVAHVRRNGQPIFDGINPSQASDLPTFLRQVALAEFPTPGVARPDFILGPYAPTAKISKGNWIIGDFKYKLVTTLADYTRSSQYFPKHALQYDAIRHYAQLYNEFPIALFLSARSGYATPQAAQLALFNFSASAWEDGFLPFVVVLLGGITK